MELLARCANNLDMSTKKNTTIAKDARKGMGPTTSTPVAFLAKVMMPHQARVYAPRANMDTFVMLVTQHANSAVIERRS